MSVITISKNYNELYELISKRSDLPVVLLGCHKCAKTSKTGGTQEVRELQ